MSLVIVKKTKDLFKERGLKTSSEAVEALNKQFEKLCYKAADNVEASKLKTVKAAHIPNLDALLSSNN